MESRNKLSHQPATWVTCLPKFCSYFAADHYWRSIFQARRFFTAGSPEIISFVTEKQAHCIFRPSAHYLLNPDIWRSQYNPKGKIVYFALSFCPLSIQAGNENLSGVRMKWRKPIFQAHTRLILILLTLPILY